MDSRRGEDVEAAEWAHTRKDQVVEYWADADEFNRRVYELLEANLIESALNLQPEWPAAPQPWR
jgi:hypothetical protein